MSFFPERRHPRFDFSHLNWIFALQSKTRPSEGRSIRVEAKNISQGGLKFISNSRFSVFELLDVTLFLETGEPAHQLQGKVVRVEEVDTGLSEKTFGIGVEFTKGMESLADSLPRSESK